MEYYKKAVLKIKAVFNQGLTPKQLALSISLAAVLGVFPFFYVPTILVALTAFVFRLNLAVMMAVNYLAYPLQVILFLPLFHLGKWILGIELKDIGLTALAGHFISNFSLALKESLSIFCITISAWTIISIPSFLILHQCILLLLKLNKKKLLST